jgi:predicted nucleic acid-binding protein
MPEVFIDTAGWASLFVKTEPYHFQALRIFDNLEREGVMLITTNYVLAELIALFHRPLRVPRSMLFRYIDTLKATPYVHIVYVDQILDTAGWTLLKARPDKSWSLVDAVSFALMQKRSITGALTTDHHFTQAGFVPLLKS